MIDYNIAGEIFLAIRGVMERHGLAGQLEVQYNKGSSRIEWVGTPSPSDVSITVSATPTAADKSDVCMPRDIDGNLTMDNPKAADIIPHAIAFANVDWFKRLLADKQRLDEYYVKCEMWGVPRDRSDAILEEVRRTSAESLYMLDVVKEATTLALKWAMDNPGKRL